MTKLHYGDQIEPIGASAQHGRGSTHEDPINADRPAFFKE
jgi:hypothetical protein